MNGGFFELSVESSFQDTIISKALSKALPEALAELSINVSSDDEPVFGQGGQVELQSSNDWYLYQSELIQKLDPRIQQHNLQPIAREQLVEVILSLNRGREEEDVSALRWVREELDQMAILEPMSV